jgi:hypothetical protein
MKDSAYIRVKRGHPQLVAAHEKENGIVPINLEKNRIS